MYMRSAPPGPRTGAALPPGATGRAQRAQDYHYHYHHYYYYRSSKTRAFRAHPLAHCPLINPHSPASKWGQDKRVFYRSAINSHSNAITMP